ncbi:unnamed protein product [Rangifer tarandus platyrhynchus]|uniref:Uncharacterized protein n=2 Tax=Rangifer tarandus platyrhynchus TaxID=3082113 RepID=A0ABN8Z8E4_RANTA|nr:unnamed protein product [Rangifer tarandus platyrhynchus]
MEFSRQEYWSRLPCPLPGDLPNPVIEPVTLALQADSLPSEPPGKPLGGVGDPNVQSIAGPNLPFQDPINERHYHPTSYSNQPTLTNFFLPSFYRPHPCQSSKFMGCSSIHIEYPSQPLHSHPPKTGHFSSKLFKSPPNSLSASDPSPVQSVHSPQVARMSF